MKTHPIDGYFGIYSAREDGEIVSHKNGKSLVLKGSKTGDYRSYSLRKDGVQTQHLGHRLIASAFIPNASDLRAVNHIDGNKQNNAVENLEWCSYSENMKHAVETGLWTSPTDEHYKIMRRNAGMSKALYTLEEASDLMEMKAELNIGCREVAAIAGCSKAVIQRIANGSQKHFKNGSVV